MVDIVHKRLRLILVQFALHNIHIGCLPLDGLNLDRAHFFKGLELVFVNVAVDELDERLYFLFDAVHTV